MIADVHGQAAAMNRSLEGPEVEKWRAEFSKQASLLAAANAKLGSKGGFVPLFPCDFQ